VPHRTVPGVDLWKNIRDPAQAAQQLQNLVYPAPGVLPAQALKLTYENAGELLVALDIISYFPLNGNVPHYL
jgi:hypothetical protein